MPRRPKRRRTMRVSERRFESGGRADVKRVSVGGGALLVMMMGEDGEGRMAERRERV